MSPEEKAHKIVEKMKPYVYCYMGSGMLTNTYDEKVATITAKQCALITVDEMLIHVNMMDDGEAIRYWKEVKQEIEKL